MARFPVVGAPLLASRKASAADLPNSVVSDSSTPAAKLKSAGATNGQTLVYNSANQDWEPGSVSGGAPGVITAEAYGAKGNGATDDTSALQAAVDFLKANGGTLTLDPTKTYLITSPLYLGNNSKTYRVTSAGGDGQINDSSATIHLSGDSGGSGPTGGAIQFNDVTSGQSAFGIEFDHIRVTYDPNSFTGALSFLVNVAPHANGAGDIQPFDIHHCSFNATSSVGPISAPGGVSAAAVGSGGTFAAGMYFWKITATNAFGETIGSTEVSATIAASGSCNLAWSAVPLATGYKVYRSTTTGSESTSPALVATINSGATVAYTDTGTAATAGGVPSHTTAFNGCQSLVRFHQAIIGGIRNCAFGASVEGIRVGDPGGSYVNVLKIEKCAFNFQQSASISIGSADCEALTIRDCTFESMPVNGSIYGASGNACYNPVIEGNWFGDQSLDTSGAAWINGIAVQSNNFVGTIRGNMFGDVYTDQYHFYLVGAWILQGNSTNGGKAVFNNSVIGSCVYILIGNYWNNPSAIFNGAAGLGNIGAGHVFNIKNILGGSPPDAANALDSHPGTQASAGTTTPSLGTTGPMTTAAPYMWLKQVSPDGQTVYSPVWK